MNIECKDINFSYGKNLILKNVSIKATKNQFVGIIGPNGSGKSTLLKCIYRNLIPTNGNIFLDDIKLSDMPIKQSAKKIAVVAQHNFYNFDFTIEEVVMMGRSPYKKNMERDNSEDYRIVNESIEQVGMSSFKGRTFSTLSGGEQQRIILARALAQTTPSIILDEPTNHLDIKYQLQLLDIVKSLNLTVISAIHDLNMAAIYCDYLYAMKDGEIIYEGTVEEVLTEEKIKNLYNVEVDIRKDKFGKLSISYCPQHLSSTYKHDTHNLRLA